ncbi:MAG: Amylopullulanase, GH57 family [Candidatus Daviesbacteria bacterium GW2011_GWA1_41_61]|uniref:Amylopullulanase, GH57 family n=1 Tax=Candidatus Daviesbacteria bacterium GW2011_GWA2_40_9 TaxID=1618424 RepID=A0A0G0U6B1_9BACT|nr:MAG: Serine/threonine-protein kinase [Candidatus Daviesbacteria bacterium GW2011_GWC1_40_9]KKR82731.1 MAG: Amylopullulanase, GH57 family [Candidatus Daviesbacteria bacterium GW2011_GWA2_40_9]KKR93801.1 MAG: Amylopullulanase, GH57 family [Candidatus Daviesbacteria bacterium GW2011_GWB1_41_15]KKS15267.1 MAG: Amylopullulanase, GH57 family [Candidatus Daviesbacteria bacterium GW2011_GWA1_41_61]
MKKAVVVTLVILSLSLIGLRLASQPLLSALGYQQKAGIRVTSVPSSTVFLNGAEVGQTLYLNEALKAGTYQVQLQAEKGSWQGIVELTEGKVTLINRELEETAASSSGEVLVLNEGQGVVIISNPSGTQVEIDGQLSGKTPLSVYELAAGDHTFLLSHEGFLKRSIRAKLPEEMSLHLNVDLALSELDLGTFKAPTVTSSATLIVKETPLGFLRVRDKPSISGKEMTQVKPGDSLIMLEEQSFWYKVRLADGSEGYVSSSYVEKR